MFTLSENKKIAFSAVFLFVVSFVFMVVLLDQGEAHKTNKSSVFSLSELKEEQKLEVILENDNLQQVLGEAKIVTDQESGKSQLVISVKE